MLNRKQLTLCAGAVLAVAAASLFWTHRAAPVPAELPRSALVLKDGHLCLKDGGAPFTGIAFERSSTGQRLTELPLVDGVVDGVARGWYDSGQQEVEESFYHGTSHGTRTRWHPNGARKSTASIIGGLLNGPYEEWHDNGQSALRMTLVEGRGQGLCEAWNADGSAKSRVILENGVPVKQEFFASQKEMKEPKTP